MDVDAEVLEPGLIRLDTRNVREITLAPPPALRGGDGSVQVVWNGVTHHLTLSAEGRTRLSASEASPSPLQKRAALEGSLSSLINTPFAVVVGTASLDALMRQRCQEKADAFAQLWDAWQHVPPRVFRDDEITAAEEQQYSLLLIGGADANSVTRRIASRLPLQVAKDAVTIDGRRLPVSDAVVQMIYPSPFQPDRYVTVVAGTSPAGMYFWNPALWNQPFGFPAVYWDWTIRDGRRVSLEAGLGPERGWVAAGMFNQQWRRDDHWIFLGDANLRASSPLRQPPASGFSIRPALLDAYAGRYELGPGYVVPVVHEGQRLTIQFPPAPPVELMAESETDFAIKGTPGSFVFTSNEQSRVTGLVINNDGQETRAKKIE
jgi:hypothetical protein